MSLLTFALLVSIWMSICAFKAQGELLSFDYKATVPLRGLLILFVVFGHLSEYTDADLFFLEYAQWGIYAVNIFFFMSGYGMMKSYVHKQNYSKNLLFRYLKKLLIPFVVVAFINWCINRCGFTCPHGWYVWELLMFAGIFNLSILFRPSALRVIVVNIIGAVFLHFVMRFVLHWPAFWWLSLLSFPIGVALSVYEGFIRKFMINHSRMVCLSFALAIICTAVMTLLLHLGICRTAFLSLLGPSILIGFYILPIPVEQKLLFCIGKVSYEFYLFHGCIRNFVMNFALPGWENIFGLFSVGLGFICALALHELLNIQKFEGKFQSNQNK